MAAYWSPVVYVLESKSSHPQGERLKAFPLLPPSFLQVLLLIFQIEVVLTAQPIINWIPWNQATISIFSLSSGKKGCFCFSTLVMQLPFPFSSAVFTDSTFLYLCFPLSSSMTAVTTNGSLNCSYDITTELLSDKNTLQMSALKVLASHLK